MEGGATGNHRCIETVVHQSKWNRWYQDRSNLRKPEWKIGSTAFHGGENLREIMEE
jgi:hypothetical protein